jgi:hypothetical protein
MIKVKRDIAGGVAVSDQLTDITVRVRPLRAHSVGQCATILADEQVVCGPFSPDDMSESLAAAAWVVGEYCNQLEDVAAVVGALVRPSSAQMPAHIQSVYLQTLLKVFVSLHTEGSAASGCVGSPVTPGCLAPDLLSLDPMDDGSVGGLAEAPPPAPAAAAGSDSAACPAFAALSAADIADISETIVKGAEMLTSSASMEVQER